MDSQGATRQGTADLAKGLAVVLMIQVHLMEIFADPVIFYSSLGRASLSLGGPPVAPVFMLILGYFLGKTRRSMSSLIVRAGGLLLIALLLNAGLNGHLFLKIYGGTFQLNPLEYLFGVDILFLAGLSVLFLAFVRPVFKRYKIAAVVTALMVAAISPTMTSMLTVDSASRYLYAFAGGTYAWSYFPLFPWLAYPILGFACSLYQDRLEVFGQHTLPPSVGFGFAVLAIVLTAKYAVNVSSDLKSYYHHGPEFFVWTILFLGVLFAALSLIHKQLGEMLPIRYLKWLGKNVLIVYILQWLIIGNIGTALYRTQSLPQITFWFLAILLAVSTAGYCVLKLSRYFMEGSRK